MSEQPHDSSDQDKSLDGELIVELTKLDLYIEQSLRRSVGDKEYEAHVARNSVDTSLDEVDTSSDGQFGSFFDLSDQAVTAAMEIMKGDANDPERIILDAFVDVDESLKEIIDGELTEKYHGLSTVSIEEGMLTFDRRPENYEGDRSPSLHISFAIDGPELKTSVFYLAMPQFPMEDSVHEIIHFDPSEYDGMVEDINLAELKKDALHAVRSALRQQS